MNAEQNNNSSVSTSSLVENKKAMLYNYFTNYFTKEDMKKINKTVTSEIFGEVLNNLQDVDYNMIMKDNSEIIDFIYETAICNGEVKHIKTLEELRNFDFENNVMFERIDPNRNINFVLDFDDIKDQEELEQTLSELSKLTKPLGPVSITGYTNNKELSAVDFSNNSFVNNRFASSSLKYLPNNKKYISLHAVFPTYTSQGYNYLLFIDFVKVANKYNKNFKLNFELDQNIYRNGRSLLRSMFSKKDNEDKRGLIFVPYKFISNLSISYEGTFVQSLDNKNINPVPMELLALTTLNNLPHEEQNIIKKVLLETFNTIKQLPEEESKNQREYNKQQISLLFGKYTKEEKGEQDSEEQTTKNKIEVSDDDINSLTIEDYENIFKCIRKISRGDLFKVAGFVRNCDIDIIEVVKSWWFSASHDNGRKTWNQFINEWLKMEDKEEINKAYCPNGLLSMVEDNEELKRDIRKKLYKNDTEQQQDYTEYFKAMDELKQEKAKDETEQETKAKDETEQEDNKNINYYQVINKEEYNINISSNIYYSEYVPNLDMSYKNTSLNKLEIIKNLLLCVGVVNDGRLRIFLKNINGIITVSLTSFKESTKVIKPFTDSKLTVYDLIFNNIKLFSYKDLGYYEDNNTLGFCNKINLCNPIRFNNNLGCEEMKKNVQDFLELFKFVICNNNNNSFDYLIKWLARVTQTKTIMNKTLPVIIGSQGCGKNTLLEPFFYILGKSANNNVTNIEQITGRFNDLIKGVHLMLLNEMDNMTSNYAGLQKLKSIITDADQTIETKGLPTFRIKNIGNYIMVSNNKQPIQDEVGDRRIVYFYCNDYYSSHKEDYAARYQLITRRDENIDDEENEYYNKFCCELYKELLEIDISDYKPMNISIVNNTEEYYNEMYAKITPEQLYIIENWEQFTDNNKLWTATDYLTSRNNIPNSNIPIKTFYKHNLKKTLSNNAVKVDGINNKVKRVKLLSLENENVRLIYKFKELYDNDNKQQTKEDKDLYTV